MNHIVALYEDNLGLKQLLVVADSELEACKKAIRNYFTQLDDWLDSITEKDKFIEEFSIGGIEIICINIGDL